MNLDNRSIANIGDIGKLKSAVRDLNTPQIIRLISGTGPSNRIQLIEALPIEALAPVLLQDQMVFRPLRIHSAHTAKLEGHIEPITFAEMKALIKAGHGEWIVEIEWSESTGQPIAWGYRYAVNTFDPEEALDRLEAIIGSGNDAAWKRTAIDALPKEYLALAIKADPEHIDELLRRIAEINPDLSRLVDPLVDAEDKELFMRAIETREDAIAALGNNAGDQMIELTPEASAVMTSLEERRKARDLLAELRGEK